MQYGLSVATPPASEPVSTAEARAHLRIDHVDDDAYIAALITAARSVVEERLRRALITQTLTLTMDHFPGAHDALDALVHAAGVIRLPRSPVQSVSSITYVDDSGVTQTLSASGYRVDTSSVMARIEPAYGETWPTTRPVSNAVTVTFVAGYGAAAAVPLPIKQAVLVLVGTWFEHREAVIVGGTPNVVPMTVDYLLGPYRLPMMSVI